MNFIILLLFLFALELSGAVPALNIPEKEATVDSNDVNDTTSLNQVNFSDERKNDSGTSGSEFSHIPPHDRAFHKWTPLWPGGVIPYEIDESITDFYKRIKIRKGMEAISSATCVKLVKRNMKNSLKPYIAFFGVSEDGKTTTECSAPIGFRNQFPQRVNQGDCEVHKENAAGSAVHETMHVLGFQHEFQREDRDSYVKVASHRHNYVKRAGDYFDIPFNFDSILNYDPKLGFREVKPREPGVPKPLGSFKNMGQECRISVGDRNLIDRVYEEECKKRSPSFVLTEHTEPVMIETTDCNFKVHPMNPDDEEIEDDENDD